MILGTAESVNGVPIRLTDERWEHTLIHGLICEATKQQYLMSSQRPS